MSREEQLYEHLRKIHFALLATVFVLLVASSLTPAAELDKAAEEAAALAGLNEALTRQRLETAMSELTKNIPADALSVHEARNRLWWRVDHLDHAIAEREPSPPRPRLWIPFDQKVYSPPYSTPAVFDVPPAERTLRQVKEIWSFLLSGQEAFIVTWLYAEDVAFRYSETSPPPRPTSDEAIADRSTAPDCGHKFMANMRLEPNGKDGTYAAILKVEGGDVADPHVMLGREAVIPVEAEDPEVELLPAVLAAIEGHKELTSQENRPFASVFRNADFYAKGLESLTIEEFRDYLERLRQERGEEVELYGAKIPQRGLSIWGVVVLVILQLYFLSHLLQLGPATSHVISAAGGYPWIGVYPDRLSRAITAISLLLVPVTAVFLLIRGWDSLETLLVKLFLSAAVLVSVVVGSLGWYRVSQLR